VLSACKHHVRIFFLLLFVMKVRKLSTPSLWVTTLIRLWLPLIAMPLPYMLAFTGTRKIQNEACWSLNEGSVDFLYISWVSWVLANIMTRVSLLHFQKWNRNSGQSILADYYVLFYTCHHQKVDEVYG
jgi:hypothetical protein